VRHVIGIGHSHLDCFTWAWRDFRSAFPEQDSYTPICLDQPPFRPHYTLQDETLVPNPAWIEAMRELITKPDAVVFLCLGGSEWWHWSLTPGPNPYDFVDPLEDDGADPIGKIIPYEMFMDHARAAFSGIRRDVGHIREIAPVPLVQFAPPPPPRDLLLDVEKMINLKDWVLNYGVSPPGFRLKIWRAACRAMEEVCASVDVHFLWPSNDNLDAEGYLNVNAAQGDSFHANDKYGLSQLQRLYARCDNQQEVS
jgi:hypothetical protein